jgi:hypothetical protein
MITRRTLLAATLTSVPVYGLLNHLSAFGASVSPWVTRQQDLAMALAQGEITAAAWQTQVEKLARHIDQDRLVGLLRDARRRDIGRALPSYPFKTAIHFRDETGAPAKLRFASALFDFEPDDVITPHAHRHMVSAHMIVQGTFRVRNYDRVGEDGDAILLRPSGDAILGTGTVSTMSSERDNVHWFVPEGGPATTFDVIVSGLDPDQPSFVIEPVDPLGGTRLANGIIRAPILGFKESARKYTAKV